MVDCLLVYPYFIKADLTQRRKRSPFPPLGLLYVASALRRAGITVRLLDCTFMRNVEEAVEAIDKYKPRVVGIHSMITLTRHGLAIARAAKGKGHTVIYGGPDASTNPEKYLRHGTVDYVVIGEGEVTAPELIQSLLRGVSPAGVRGMAYLNGGRIVRTPPREPTKNLDSLPLPARDLVDNEYYKSVWRRDHGFALTSIMTTRGCPFGCFFCSEKAMYGRRYNVRSMGNVVDELEEIVKVYGYDRVWFADDIFPLIKKRTIGICDEIKRRGLDFSWSCLARPDLVDEETLRSMKEAGCDLIFYGVESGSQRMLDAMNRDMTIQHIRDGVRAAKKVGMRVHTFLMMGFPGENYDSIQDTIRFLRELNPDEYSFTIAYPLPGTELFHMVERLDDILEWESPGENRLLFKSNIPERGLRFAIWKAKYEFYLHRRVLRGQRAFRIANKLFKASTDLVLRAIVPQQIWEPKFNRCEVMSLVLANAPK